VARDVRSAAGVGVVLDMESNPSALWTSEQNWGERRTLQVPPTAGARSKIYKWRQTLGTVPSGMTAYRKVIILEFLFQSNSSGYACKAGQGCQHTSRSNVRDAAYPAPMMMTRGDAPDVPLRSAIEDTGSRDVDVGISRAPQATRLYSTLLPAEPVYVYRPSFAALTQKRGKREFRLELWG
jgi:hypothetical protein